MVRLIFLLFDILTITSSFFLAKLLRFHSLGVFVRNEWTTLIFLIFTILLLNYFYDLYNHYFYAQLGRVFFKILNVWIIAFILFILVGFLTKFYFLINSRSFIFLFFAFFPILSSILRVVVTSTILTNYFNVSRNRITTIYVGPEERYSQFKNFFDNNVISGLNLISNQKDICVNSRQIFLFSEKDDYGELYKEIQRLAKPGVRLHIASPLLNELPMNWEWCKIENIPIYTFIVNSNKTWQEILRRFLDIIISSLCLIILFPLFIVVTIAIKLDSPGSVIYKQKRCGYLGKEFTFYKFRSMYNNNKDYALKREKEFKDYIENKTLKGKIIDNSEITPVGKVLRRTSIDEFPQFFNVLKGDMTLIGPRPPIPYEVKYYKDWHKDRLKVKPGISGLWQVYGRGSMPCDSSIFLDLLYTMNRSITLDLKLLFQTIPAVLLGKGAY
jgi:undecaprenyl-phosphate galactose phosphotransferase